MSPGSRTCRRLTVLVAAIVVTSFAPGPASAITPTGLVAAYSFNEGTGTTVADLSGSGNAGTTANTSWVVGGKFGGALSFNGTSSWVTVPDAASLDLSTAMTLEAWVRPTTLGTTYRTVLMKQQPAQLAYALYANSNVSGPAGNVFTGNEREARGAAQLPLAAWTHLAATYDGTMVRLYVNGTLSGTRSAGGTIATSADPLRIGGNSVRSEWFSGLIDEVRVYNRALGAAEIQADMNQAVGDAAAPTAPSGLAVTGVTGTSVSIAWTASTDNVGIAGYGLYLDGAAAGSTTSTSATLTGLPCGTSHTVEVDAFDSAGNRSPRTAVAVATPSCDTTAPTAPSGLAQTGSTASTVTLTWSASFDDVGVAGYGLYLNGAAAGSAAVPMATLSGLACGTAYTVGVDAFDAAGNRSAQATIAARTGPCDTTAPTAPSGLSITGTTATSVSVSWTASTDNVGVAGYGLYLDGTAAGSTTVTSATLTGLACGASYTVEVDAFDAAGNRSPRTAATAATRACDTTPPAISITAPVDAATVSSAVTITAAASDNVGVVGVRFRVDGVDLGAEDTTAPYSAVWATTGFADGTHALTAVVRDAAGNVATSAQVTVVVSNLFDTSNALKRVVVGAGFVDPSTREVVRTAGGRVYAFLADDTPQRQGTGPGVIRAWKGNQAGIPTSFAEVDALHRPAATGVTHVLGSPDARLDRAGIVHVVYVNESDKTVVYRTFSTVTDTWSAPVVIGTGATYTTSAIKRSGNATVVLDVNDVPHVAYATATAIMYTNRVGGSWAPPTQLSAGTAPLHPVLAFDGADNLHVSWLDVSAGPAPAIKYKVRPAGGAWGADEIVAGSDVLTNNNSDQGPSIVVTPSGTPYVLYVSALPGSSIRVRHRAAAGGWIGDDPPTNVFTHTPTIYGQGDDVYAFLGHDVNIHYGYLSRLAGTPWSAYTVLDAASTVDGSASTRWDPQRETNANVIDTLYYDEDTLDNKTYLPQAYYMAVLPKGARPADTTAPTVAVTAPGSGATVAGSVGVAANAADDVGVAGVQFQLDGASLGAEDTTAPYAVTWGTTGVADGQHTLSAVARDAAGNRTTSAPVTVTVSNAAPPPGEPIALVKQLGTNSVANIGGSISLQVPATGVAAGHTVVVWAQMSGAGGVTISTVTDSRGNTYVVDSTLKHPTTGINSFVASGFVGVPLAGSDTITITFAGTYFSQRLIAAAEFSGLSAANRLDRLATGTGSGAAVATASTASTTQASELVVAAFASDTLATFTPGAGFTALPSVGISASGSSRTIYPAYRVASAVGTFQATGTLSASSLWTAAVATYR